MLLCFIGSADPIQDLWTFTTSCLDHNGNHTSCAQLEDPIVKHGTKRESGTCV